MAQGHKRASVNATGGFLGSISSSISFPLSGKAAKHGVELVETETTEETLN